MNFDLKAECRYLAKCLEGQRVEHAARLEPAQGQ